MYVYKSSRDSRTRHRTFDLGMTLRGGCVEDIQRPDWVKKETNHLLDQPGSNSNICFGKSCKNVRQRRTNIFHIIGNNNRMSAKDWNGVII